MNDYLHQIVYDVEQKQRERDAANWRRAQPIVQAKRRARRRRVIAWVRRIFGGDARRVRGKRSRQT